MKNTLLAATPAALCAATALAGYLQHVEVDVSDSRRNFPLRVARGEVLDVSFDFFDEGAPIAFPDGAAATLHTRTNSMDAALSWQTSGSVASNAALFVLDVDAVLPAASGEWTVVVEGGGRVLARAGGQAYVRGGAAASVAADPVSALSGYATTGYVAQAVAAIDVEESDPAFEEWRAAWPGPELPSLELTGGEYPMGGRIPGVPYPSWRYKFWGNYIHGRKFLDGVEAEDWLVWLPRSGGWLALDADVSAAAVAGTNYTDAAIAAIDIPAPDLSFTNDYARVESLGSAFVAATNHADEAVADLRAEAEAGWLSEWVCDPAEIETDDAVVEWTQGGWIVKGQQTGAVFTLVPKGTQDSDTLSWSAEEAIYAISATRHRVSAPVPTKPEDIGAASTADATLAPIYSQTPTFSEWTISPSGKFTEVLWLEGFWSYPQWGLSFAGYPIPTLNADPDATSITAKDTDGSGTVYTATRTRTDIIGYTLGDQTGKPLQPKVDDLASIRSGAALGATAVQPGLRNLLDYATGTTLSPATAVYRTSANLSGTDAAIPTPDATAIPAANAYFCFELEVSVDATATSLAGPSGWTWSDGGKLPTSGFAGATLYIAARLDCTTRAVLANVWRVEEAAAQ